MVNDKEKTAEYICEMLNDLEPKARLYAMKGIIMHGIFSPGTINDIIQHLEYQFNNHPHN